MNELLIFLAMCVVAWLAYARGHNAGVRRNLTRVEERDLRGDGDFGGDR